MTEYKYEGLTIDNVMDELTDLDERRAYLIVARDRLILDMHDNGLSLRDIAPKVKMTPVGVNKARERAAKALRDVARLAGL